MARQIDPRTAVSTITGQWESFIDTVNETAERTLRDSGERLKTRAMALVPVKTGALRASAVLDTARDADGAEMAVSFGGGSVDYAVRVHEDLQSNRETGISGFLRVAGEQVQGEIDGTIADGMKKAAKEGNF